MQTKSLLFILVLLCCIAAVLFAADRSSRWHTVRDNFIKTHSRCAVCGGDTKLEVHHKQTFSSHPELELDANNLITLCEAKRYGINCHLLIGHCGNYRWSNPDVVEDANCWNKKIKEAKNH
jgi:hypothetical protein